MKPFLLRSNSKAARRAWRDAPSESIAGRWAAAVILALIVFALLKGCELI